MLQRLFARRLAEVPAQPSEPSSGSRLLDQVQALPFFAPVRLYLDTLEKMRPWWPVLLPVLAWVFYRSYQQERGNFALPTNDTA